MKRGRGSDTALDIRLLADCRDMIPVLARWFRKQWSDQLPMDPEESFARCARRNALPQSLVAFRAQQAVGTVSVLPTSVASHPQLSPWVAALYVRPACRHAGIATQMVSAALEQAWSLGFDRIYIGIQAAREHYEKLGWRFEALGSSNGETILILRKSL